MADRTRFKHIRVDAANDDVVIYAGAHDAMRSSAEEADTAVGSEEATIRMEASAASDSSSLAGAGASAAGSNAQPASSDGYRATTLQDIKTSKMPAMQKAIIVIAVLAVAAFLIWYLSFR